MDTQLQMLINVTAEYGCCFNTIVTEYNSRRYGIVLLDVAIYVLILHSNEVSDQIENMILTSEIYEFCGITSGGFCEGVCSGEVGQYYCYSNLFCFRQPQHTSMMLNYVLMQETHSLQMILV